MLLAVTMMPAAGLQQAHADEPTARPQTTGGDVALAGAAGGEVSGENLPDAPIADGAEFVAGGLSYRVAGDAAVLVGFENGAALEGAVVVPERVSDGSGTATVKAVEVAEGQVVEGVTSLTLPQTVESVRTEGLAAALPALASIEIASAAESDGSGAAGKAAYSSVAGMLFRSAEGQASSDGEAFAEDALELVWAPPAMVVARIPLECKSIASGAFVDAAALETVMSFGKMESIASAERDAEGNVTKPGAFADEQIARLTIVVPGTNYAVTGEGAERVSGSVALSEKTDMLEKRKAWFHHGFDTEQIIMGAPFGEIEGVNAVSDEGVMEDRSLVTPLENGKSHLELTPEEEAEKAERRGEDPEAGLSFSYQASMDLSVRWSGDRSATPAHIDVPAYAKVDGVTYQVTAIEPSAFEGAVFLASVTIPEGVTSIGESAFAGCTNLKSVSLPSTLKTIDYAAFKGTALESVDIPDSVRWIGGEAFDEWISTEASQASNWAEPHATDLTAYSSDGYYHGFVGDLPETITGYRSVGPIAKSMNANWFRYSGARDDPYGNTYDEVMGFNGGPNNWFAPAYEIVYWPNRTVRNFTFWYDDRDKYVVPFAFDVWGFDGSARMSSEVYAFDSAYSLPSADLEQARILIGTGDIAAHDGSLSGQECWRTFRSHNNFSSYRLTNGKVAASVPPAPSVGSDRFAVLSLAMAYLITYRIDYSSDCSGMSGLRTSFTVEDDDKHLVDPADNARPGYRFVGWTGPGNPDTPKKGSEFNIDVTGVTGEELTYTAHWEKQSTARFVSGSGQHFDNISYYKGDAPDLPSAQRTGFWFAGWYPTTGAEWWDGKQDGHTLYNGKMPADAYGDVTFNAVWTPKAYTVRYDTEQSKDKGGNRAVDPPADKTFVHPSAANAIAGASGLTFGIAEDGSTVSGLDVAANSYFDLASVRKSWCEDYSLGEPDKKLGAYPFKGWCKIDDLAIGTVPGPSDGGNARYWTELREKDADGSFTDTNYFFAIFGEGWSDFSKDQCSTPYTVYGVWGTTSESAIALAPTQPSYLTNIGEQAVDADGRGSSTRGTEGIRFRENMGFIGQESASADSDAEQLHTGTQERHEADCEIDAEMNLRAPVRYGFEFLGWGAPASASTDADAAKEGDATVARTTDVSDPEIYVSYDEDAARGGSKTGFVLTEKGSALVKDADGSLTYNGPNSWSAYWRTRTVDVALRIPLHAVSEADMTGASTGADRNQQDDGSYVHPKATKAEYTDGYKWREGDASETENGSSSGWYIAKRTWNYYDLLEYPEFKTQKDRYTYDGWYHVRKPSMTDSTDKALEDLAGTGADLTKVASYQALEAERADGKFSTVHVTGGNVGDGDAFQTDAGIDVGDAYFTVGDPSAKNAHDGAAAVELWLWTSPIRINVASPIGVYLCTTNSYGQPVEPFVVGNDRRTQLEAQATFQVATGSHDLQLVGVTAEDVTAFGYEKNDDGSTVTIDGNIPKVDADSVESSAASDKVGMASKILTPKATDKTDNMTYDAEGSRMFWVSPVPTATADQTGVVYKGDSTAQTEAGKVPGTSNLEGDEAALKPDVETRRYFGCGYKRVKEDGTIEFALDDNDIEDSLPSAADGGERQLDGFVLRRHDNYESGSRDGLALLKYDDASKTSTYRFYYGLDMRRADFNLAGLQDLIENNQDIDYNSAFDQPLLRVKFTFAAARNPGISYFSARGGDEGATEKISEETVITVGSAS